MNSVVDLNIIEKTIISSLINFKDVFDKSARNLKPEHFNNPSNASIFNEIRRIKTQGLDLDFPTLMLRLNKNLQNALLQIANTEPTINYKIYIEQLSKNFILKKQAELAKRIMEETREGNLFSLDQLLANIEDAPKTFKTFQEWASEDNFKKEAIVYKTGVDFIDKLLGGGIALGQLVLLSGEPEAGKTSLGTQILENVSFRNKAAFFCFEFTVEQYVRSKMNSEKQFANTGGKNLYIVNEEYSIDKVADNIRFLYKSYGVKFFLIDSQMRIETHKARSLEEEETTKFSVLAKLAHQLNIVIFFIVQTSKTDTQNPSGTKKGAHEASIAIKIEHVREKNQENIYNPTQRKVSIWKNKQNGKHNIAKLRFDPFMRYFKEEIKEDMQEVEFKG